MDFLQQVGSFFIIRLLLITFLLYISVFLINKLVHWFFKKSKFLGEEKQKTIENLISSALNYIVIVIIILYILSPFIDISGLLAGAGVIGVILAFALQNIIRDIFVGAVRIYEKQFNVDDFITINGIHSGTITEVGVRFLSIRKWNGKLLTISHGEIKEIENYNKNMMRVIERITISYQESPEKIKSILENVCASLNQNYEELLLRDENDEIIQEFQYYGITNINTHKGYEYTIVGLVVPKNYWDARKFARFEIAKELQQSEVRLGETNIYSRARLSTKS